MVIMVRPMRLGLSKIGGLDKLRLREEHKTSGYGQRGVNRLWVGRGWMMGEGVDDGEGIDDDGSLTCSYWCTPTGHPGWHV